MAKSKVREREKEEAEAEEVGGVISSPAKIPHACHFVCGSNSTYYFFTTSISLLFFSFFSFSEASRSIPTPTLSSSSSHTTYTTASTSKTHHVDYTIIIILTVSSAAFLAFLLVSAMAVLRCFGFKLKRKQTRVTSNSLSSLEGISHEPLDQKDDMAGESGNFSVRKLSWDEIERSTNNFCKVIGSGGYSNVYLARKPSGFWAIKINNGSERLNQVFKQELDILLHLQHPHIVKLLGYCDKQEEGALVFEYVANGNLQDKLHGGESSPVLPWKNRMAIAFQIAQALEYLHEKCPLQIVHMDIKASNILLDQDLNKKTLKNHSSSEAERKSVYTLRLIDRSERMGETNTVHSPLVTYASMLSLLCLCPPFVILLWYTMVHADGSISQTWDYLKHHGLQGFIEIWPRPTATAWKIIACYGAFEAALQLLLPGKRVEGPISPTGNRPVYKANGMAAYFVTLATHLGLWWFGIFNPTIVYDHLGEIFSALIFGSFIFCILLYIKGHLAPSSTDSGSSGNAIIDFYWGMELYPRIGKNFDIKVFTNCRFGMMSWAVLAVTYCIKQYEVNGTVADSMLVNTILMLVYVTKFFWWEAGYWNTMDIAHDRAGFYICWGCLVWVPSIYTSPGMYLVNHPVNLGTQLALFILVAGILCIYINYDCDRQRQEFRRTNGKCLVWGKAPSKIVASYTTTSGETKTSLLLTSGWWGLSRHFHYVPEISAAFFWTVPALFNHFLPYFYVVFLTILLLDRAKRDDDRCRSKYGKYWKLYCQKVSYRVIPGIY